MLQDQPMYAYLPATDVARARRFYEQVLGFKPGEILGGVVTCTCANGTACFLYPLRTRAPPGPARRSGRSPT